MVDEGHSVPPLRPGPSLAAVAGGGALGTLVRAELLRLQTSPGGGAVTRSGASLALPHSWTSYIPWWLLAINTVGVLLAALALAGPLRGRSPEDEWRLFVVTGALGGLTSYSSLIRDVAAIRSVSLPGSAVVLVGAVGAGLVAAWAGVTIARFRWP
jgi:fluoride exporter